MTAFLQGSDGDLVLPRGQFSFVSGAEQKRQKIENRLVIFQGEWFLDTRAGLPYYAVVFVKNPDLDVVKRLFKDVIESVPGIVEADVTIDFDAAARHLTYTWVATDDEGQTIEGGTTSPLFIASEG